MDEERVYVSRRTFLTVAAAAPALAVAALLARRNELPIPALPSEAPVPSTGYHETEHIRAYYRSAAF